MELKPKARLLLVVSLSVAGLVMLAPQGWPGGDGDSSAPVPSQSDETSPTWASTAPPTAPPTGVAPSSGGASSCAVPSGDTLQLPSLPPDGIATFDAASCPNRYVFANTHTFGRHHNQLQEMMNTIIWASRLNRTAVLGWFRHNHAWIDPKEFYDFDQVARRYCVVTADRMMANLRSKGGITAECFGQGFADTPLKRFVGRAARCVHAAGVPRYYNSRYGARVTRTFLPRILASPADILVLSGEVAFFMRAGLALHAAAYRHLRPNAEIAAEVTNFEKSKLGHAAGSGYFAVHLRQRERECMKEVRDSFDDGAAHLGRLGAAARTVISTQCAVTVPHVRCLQQSLGLRDTFPMFLASDHQNLALEQDLVAHGAVMYEGGRFHTREIGGLKGMAVDFFLMARARYFTGNQLSSVTQNACFMRLGSGRGCHGVVREFTEFHTRDLAEEPLTDISALRL